MSIEFELEQVSGRTTAIIDQGGLHSNAGAVALDSFIVAIDPTMIPAAARAFRQKLERQFSLPVKFLLVTHYHADHVFGVAPFKDTCVIGSIELTANILKRKDADWSPEARERWKQSNPEDADLLDGVEILIPTLGFRDRLEIRDGDQVVELCHTGGHTDCSAYVYVPHERVLFAGDLMFAKGFPYAGDPTCDPDRWMGAFRELLSLDFVKLVPGHGPVVGRDEVEKHLAFFEALRDATQEAIGAGEGPDAIEVPEFYGLGEQDAWVRKATLEHWYAFYTGAE
ncbi:MAG: MBL fold metallo-hydrolase [Anaerolineae bacterium]|nr:MBL fold metallo-hydrolase [Anaerolineae bacterium]